MNIRGSVCAARAGPSGAKARKLQYRDLKQGGREEMIWARGSSLELERVVKTPIPGSHLVGSFWADPVRQQFVEKVAFTHPNCEAILRHLDHVHMLRIRRRPLEKLYLDSDCEFAEAMFFRALDQNYAQGELDAADVGSFCKHPLVDSFGLPRTLYPTYVLAYCLVREEEDYIAVELMDTCLRGSNFGQLLLDKLAAKEAERVEDERERTRSGAACWDTYWKSGNRGIVRPVLPCHPIPASAAYWEKKSQPALEALLSNLRRQRRLKEPTHIRNAALRICVQQLMWPEDMFWRMVDRVDIGAARYACMSLQQLKALARQYSIPGRSSMRRAELEVALTKTNGGNRV